MAGPDDTPPRATTVTGVIPLQETASGVPAGLTDLDLLALTVYGEARGEPVEGKVGVAWVLANRLRTGRWGHTYREVALARRQFSCWNPGDENADLLVRIAADLQRGQRPLDAAWLECRWVADGVYHGIVRPNVRNATHYYASTIAPPGWSAPPAVLTATLGRHRFFQNVA